MRESSNRNKVFLFGGLCAILVNSINFILGYGDFNQLDELHTAYFFQNEYVFAISNLLLSLGSLGLWFFFYNKIASPHSTKAAFRKDFIKLFVVAFLCTTYFVSYRYGFALHAKNATKEVQLVEQINRANSAMLFFPTNRENYGRNNDCDSATKTKELDSWAVQRDSTWYDFKEKFEDSLRSARGLNKMDIVVLNYYAFHPDHLRKRSYEEEYEEEVKAIKKDKDLETYSYFNYCKKQFSTSWTFLEEKDNSSISNELENILLPKNKGKVKKELSRFLKNLQESQVDYRLNLDRYIEQAFDNNSRIGDHFYQIAIIDGDRNNADFIHIEDYQNFLNNVANVKKELHDLVWKPLNWYYLLFISFGMSFLVFMRTSTHGNIKNKKRQRVLNATTIGLAISWVFIHSIVSSMVKPFTEKFDSGELVEAFVIREHSFVYAWLQDNNLVLLFMYFVFLWFLVCCYFIPKTISNR